MEGDQEAQEAQIREEFDNWIEQKKYLHFRDRSPRIRIGEVWWCSVGYNVGVEINGKGSTYIRPVVIYKVLGRYSFLGIPLTSQPKHGTWYAEFTFKNRAQYAALCSMRAMSKARLFKKYGELSKGDYLGIINALRRLYIDENIELIRTEGVV